MKYIHTEDAPAAIGPYSQAVASGSTIYCSGQLGIDPTTRLTVEGVAAQTTQALRNLQHVLGAAGASIRHIVKTTIYLKNITDYPAVNLAYANFMGANKPARATVEVSALPSISAEGAVPTLVEIDCIAVVQ